MDTVCRMKMGDEEYRQHFRSNNLNGRPYFEDLDIHGITGMLKWFLKLQLCACGAEHSLLHLTVHYGTS